MYIALFRGINVGGKNTIPMKSLKERIEALGYSDVSSYIQSGNILFRSSPSKAKKFPTDVQKAICDQFGFKPEILLLSVEKLKAAMGKNPFPEAEKNPKSLHFYFLEHPPKDPNLEKLTQLKVEREAFALIGDVLYLYAPDGIGRSKLASNVEKLLGVKATARNANTVRKLLEMST